MATPKPTSSPPDATWAVLRLGEPPAAFFRDRDLALIQAGVYDAQAAKHGQPSGFVVRYWCFGRLRPRPAKKEQPT